MKKIVYIDDEEDLLEVFQTFISILDDFEVETFNTHQGGLTYLKNHNVDGIFIDWRMKEGNSVDFYKKIQNVIQSTKIFIITGELDLVKPNGFESIIPKPFSLDKIRAILNTL